MTQFISNTALDLIKCFEGFGSRLYVCPAGYPTIGYGHMVREYERPLYENREISEAEAMILLLNDVAATVRSVSRQITVPLTQAQWDALVDFTFNLGSAALQRSSLRRKINRGEHELVPPEMMRWVWGGRPPRRLKGLVLRRTAEAQMYASG